MTLEFGVAPPNPPRWQIGWQEAIDSNWPGSIHQIKRLLLPMKTALQQYTSRTADKFVVRLPEGMRDRIAEVAKQHHRSMNSEIIARLEHSLLDLPSLPEYPSRQTLGEQRVEELNQPERELLMRFREMSRRQQNALIALLAAEQA